MVFVSWRLEFSVRSKKMKSLYLHSYVPTGSNLVLDFKIAVAVVASAREADNNLQSKMEKRNPKCALE
jgi:hypothetical protein